MSHRTAARLAWGLWAVSAVVLATGFVLFVFNLAEPSARGEGLGVLLVVPVLAFSSIGALIASRQPENAIGWMFCTTALVAAAWGFTQEYAIYALIADPGSLPGGVWMAWLSVWLTFPSIFLAPTLLLLLFPNGSLLSPRWRPVLWLAVATIAALVIGTAFRPGQFSEDPFHSVDNPAGIEGARLALEALAGGAWLLVVVLVAASATSSVLRFRRAHGDERQQLKWIAGAAGLVGITWIATAAGYGSSVAAAVTAPLSAAAIVTIPIATGIAILRYRLYDIDRIINRGVVYGLLTVALGLTYFGLVISLQALFQPLTGGSDVAIALTTLVVAALFLPARRRIQDAVDSRFNRRRYDAARTLESFSSRLRDEVDLETLQGDLIAVVNATVQPAHVSLWLAGSERGRSPVAAVRAVTMSGRGGGS